MDIVSLQAVGTTLTIHLSRLSSGGLIGLTKARKLCRFILGFVQTDDTEEIKAMVASGGRRTVRCLARTVSGRG